MKKEMSTTTIALIIVVTISTLFISYFMIPKLYNESQKKSTLELINKQSRFFSNLSKTIHEDISDIIKENKYKNNFEKTILSKRYQNIKYKVRYNNIRYSVDSNCKKGTRLKNKVFDIFIDYSEIIKLDYMLKFPSYYLDDSDFDRKSKYNFNNMEKEITKYLHYSLEESLGYKSSSYISKTSLSLNPCERNGTDNDSKFAIWHIQP